MAARTSVPESVQTATRCTEEKVQYTTGSEDLPGMWDDINLNLMQKSVTHQQLIPAFLLFWTQQRSISVVRTARHSAPARGQCAKAFGFGPSARIRLTVEI